MRQGDGLLQVVEGAGFDGLYGLVGIAEGGDHGHGHVELFFVDVFHHFEPRTVGHAHIGEHEGELFAVEPLFGGIDALGGFHRQAHFHQGHFHQVADVLFVVHNQHWFLQALFTH